MKLALPPVPLGRLRPVLALATPQPPCDSLAGLTPAQPLLSRWSKLRANWSHFRAKVVLRDGCERNEKDEPRSRGNVRISLDPVPKVLAEDRAASLFPQLFAVIDRSMPFTMDLTIWGGRRDYFAEGPVSLKLE